MIFKGFIISILAVACVFPVQKKTGDGRRSTIKIVENTTAPGSTLFNDNIHIESKTPPLVRQTASLKPSGDATIDTAKLYADLETNRRYDLREGFFENAWISSLKSDDGVTISLTDDDVKLGTQSQSKDNDHLVENRFFRILVSGSGPLFGSIRGVTTAHNNHDQFDGLGHRIRVGSRVYRVSYDRKKISGDQRQRYLIFSGKLIGLPGSVVQTAYIVNWLKPYMRIVTNVKLASSQTQALALVETIRCRHCSFHSDTALSPGLQKSNTFFAVADSLNYAYRSVTKPLHVGRTLSGVQLTVAMTVGRKKNAFSTERHLAVGDAQFSPFLYNDDLGQVTGFIVDGQNNPLNGIDIAAVNLKGEVVTMMRSDNEGFYQHFLPAGYYQLRARVNNQDSNHNLSLEIKPYMRTVTRFSFSELSGIRYRVVDSRGRHVPFRMTILSQNNAPDWTYSRQNGGGKGFVYGHQQQGTFALSPGTYRVMVTQGIFHSVCQRTLRVRPGHFTWLKCKLRRELSTGQYRLADLVSFTNQTPGVRTTIEQKYLMHAAEGLDLIAFTDIGVVNRAFKSLGHLPRTIAAVGVDFGPYGFLALYGAAIEQLPDYQKVKNFKDLAQTHDRGALLYAPYNPLTFKHTTKQIRTVGRQKTLQMLNVWSTDVEAKRNAAIQQWYRLLRAGSHILPVAGNLNKGSTRGPISYPVTLVYRGRLYNMQPDGIVDPNDANHTLEESGSNPETAIADESLPKPLLTTLKTGNVVLTNGPIIDLRINDRVRPGGTAIVRDSRIKLSLKVSASSWQKLKEVRIIADGKVLKRYPIRKPLGKIRFAKTMYLNTRNHKWLHVIVEGEKYTIPFFVGRKQVKPFAMTSAVWLQNSEGR